VAGARVDEKFARDWESVGASGANRLGSRPKNVAVIALWLYVENAI